MSKTLLKSAVFIMIITLVGRVMGLVRNIFVNYQFGTTTESSAYFLAFTIPSAIFAFVPGALNAIFIPSLKKLVIDGKREEAKQLTQKLLTLTLLLSLIICIIGWIWAEPIISFIAPESSEELKILAAHLLRWMLPSILFIMLIGVFSSTLNVHNSFVLPNVGTIINSLILIAVLFIFVPVLGIYALALGTTLGFAGAALIMLPKVYLEKYTLRPNWHWNDPELKKIGERFLPIMLGSFITSINEFIEKFLVSGYGDDKIAVLVNAKTIYQVPMAVFVTAFAMPLFPLLVEYLRHKDLENTKATIEKGLSYLLILMIPTTVGICLLSQELVSVLYQRGKFDQTSTELTAFALLFFTLGLYPLAVRDLLTRAFYALENTVIPVLAGILQILMYVVGSYLFMPLLGYAAAAMGWTVGAICNVILLWIILQRKIGNFVSRFFMMTALKALGASAVMGAALFLFQSWTPDWNRYLHLTVAILLGALVYGLMLLLFKEPLTKDLLDKVKSRVIKNS